MSLTRPIKEFVKRKLNERGFYDIRDIRGLAHRNTAVPDGGMGQ